MTELESPSFIFRQDIWGPVYWFFLMTIALNYPDHANAVMKRKYYDLLQNLPLFIPDSEMGTEFSRMLDKYPVTPYLDYRESFIKWVVFIHNRMNVKLGKREITEEEAIDQYMRAYVDESQIKLKMKNNEWRKYAVFLFVLCILLGVVYYLYQL
jgi:hypothetical protein